MAVLVVAGGTLWWFRAPLGAWVRSMAVEVKTVVGIKPEPDPKTYASLVEELERWRLELAARHKRAKTPAERAAAEHDARVILEQTLPAMMRRWLKAETTTRMVSSKSFSCGGSTGKGSSSSTASSLTKTLNPFTNKGP
jgi:hypothetical protein